MIDSEEEESRPTRGRKKTQVYSPAAAKSEGMRRPLRESRRVAAVAAKKLLSQEDSRSPTPTDKPKRGRPRKNAAVIKPPRNSVKKVAKLSQSKRKRRQFFTEDSSDDNSDADEIASTGYPQDLEEEGNQLDFSIVDSDVDMESADEVDDSENIISSQSSTKATRYCPWIEREESLAPLNLPPSSEDLLIPLRLVPTVLEVYEVLRRFSLAIQLTPFRIEDFCAGLIVIEPSPLIGEVHVALLKALMKEDELSGVTLSRLEDKGYAYAATHMALDLVTWPALLRSYLESHRKFDSLAREICAKPEFPKVCVDEKVVVLKFLANRFVATEHFAKLDLQTQDHSEHSNEDNCRQCGKVGDLIVCDRCPAVYHLYCLNPPRQSLPVEFICSSCVHAAVEGVKQLNPIGSPENLRNCPIGVDRHGRHYYFVARRIFIESLADDKGVVSLWYYSCEAQLDKLLEALDGDELEKDLFDSLTALKDEIVADMKITMTLTTKFKPPSIATSYLQAVQDNQPIDPAVNLATTSVSSSSDSSSDSGSEVELEAENVISAEDLELLRRFEADEIDEDDLTDGDLEKLIEVRDIRDRNLKIAEAQKDRLDLKQKTAKTVAVRTVPVLFKLGMEKGHCRYVNHYRVDQHLQPYAEQKAEGKRMRTALMKFCPKEAEKFNWKLTDPFSFANILRTVLIDCSRRVPGAFFNSSWKSVGASWNCLVLKASQPQHFAKCLTIFEQFLRRILFLPFFTTGLGDIELVRETTAERDRRKLVEKLRKDQKQQEEAVLSCNPENSDAVENDIVWVKYPNGLPKHQIWKGNPDEFYRVNGNGCLGGWIWFSCNWGYFGSPQSNIGGFKGTVVSQQSPYKEFINDVLSELKSTTNETVMDNESEVQSDITDGSQLACATLPLTLGADGLSWVPEKQLTINRLQLHRHTTTVDVSLGLREKSVFFVSAQETLLDGLLRLRSSCPVTATNMPFKLKTDRKLRGGQSWKCRFLCNRSGKRNILVLPRSSLRPLARRGGQMSEIPGFIETAKSNTNAWPYHCPRPNFRTCWLFTLTSDDISVPSVALHLRQLHSLIRWDQVDKSGSGPAKVITHDDGLVIQREILGHKDCGDGSLMYLVRTLQLQYEMLEEDMEGRKTKSRRILKTELKPHIKAVTSDSHWMQESEVSLSQLRHYHEDLQKGVVMNENLLTVGTNDVSAADIEQLIQNARVVETEDEFRERLNHLAQKQRTAAFDPKQVKPEIVPSTPGSGRRAGPLTKLSPTAALKAYGKYDFKMAKLMDATERSEYWRLHECDKVLQKMLDKVVAIVDLPTEKKPVGRERPSLRSSVKRTESPVYGKIMPKAKPPVHGYGFKTIRGKFPLTAFKNPTQPLGFFGESPTENLSKTEKLKRLDVLAAGLRQEIVKRRILLIKTVQRELAMEELDEQELIGS